MGSGAVVDAVNKLKIIIGDVLCGRFGGTPAELLYADDTVSFPGEQSVDSSATESGMDSRLERKPCASCTTKGFIRLLSEAFKAPEVSWDDETGEGSPYFTYVYSCQAAEVLVNAVYRKRAGDPCRRRSRLRPCRKSGVV